MAKYTVYKNSQGNIEAVRHGWNWTAFLWAGIWLPYKKLWKETLLFYGAIIFVAIKDWPEWVAACAALAWSLYAGAAGADLLDKCLIKRGFRSVGNFDASGGDDAISKYMASEKTGVAPPPDFNSAFCSQCGVPVNTDSKFCTKCGAAVAA